MSIKVFERHAMSPNTIFKIAALSLVSLSSSLALGPPPVILGAAGNFAVLAQAGVTTVPQSLITGNVGLSPAASLFITGFAMAKSPSGTSASSTQVVGLILAADFTSPTPSNLTLSIGALTTAFTDAAGRVAPASSMNLGKAGAIDGLTFAPGVFKWTSAVSVGSTITIKGSSTDTWIFQISQTLTLADGASVVLTGGAVPKNIVWVVSGKVTLGSESLFQGVLLGATSAGLSTGATVKGRLLVGTAVTMQKAIISAPA